MNINNINFQKEFYNNKKFCVIDNILNIETAKDLQKEIVESLDEHWDRYENPFEKNIHGEIKIIYCLYLKNYLIIFIHQNL